MPRLDSIPFESQFQYMATLPQQTDLNQNYLCQRLSRDNSNRAVSRCWIPQPILVNREQIEQEVNNLAKQGLRVLAFAKKPVATRTRC